MNATVWTLNRNDNTESLLKTHSMSNQINESMN